MKKYLPHFIIGVLVIIFICFFTRCKFDYYLERFENPSAQNNLLTNGAFQGGKDIGEKNKNIGNNKIIKLLKLPTYANKGGRIVISQVIKAIELIISGIDKKNILGIGLGVPGPCDYKKGILIKPPK